jgi:bis(5'-nucleosidyl)-tetraphosphatase
MGEVRHTRSAGGVVLGGRGRVIVVSQHGTSWSLPKGGLEEGEDDLAAARREIREETGVTDLRLIRDLGDYRRFRMGADGGEDPSELKTIRLFLFETDETDLRPADPDNPEARWVTPEEAASLLTHEKDREFFLRSLTLFADAAPRARRRRGLI